MESDSDYLYKHYRETHDIHHLLTRYGIDTMGEVELQAFYFGNLGLRHAALSALLSFPVGLTQRGLDVRALRAHFRRLRAAYRRGKHSRNLLSVDYGERWTTPVSELAGAAVLLPAVALEDEVALHHGQLRLGSRPVSALLACARRRGRLRGWLAILAGGAEQALLQYVDADVLHRPLPHSGRRVRAAAR